MNQYYQNFQLKENQGIQNSGKSLGENMSRNNYNNYYNKKHNFEKKEHTEHIKQDVKPELTEEKTEVVEEHKSTYIGLVSGASKVYMRSAADKEAEPVDTLNEGSELEILEDSNPEWYKVCNAAGIEGYIMKAFVTI